MRKNSSALFLALLISSGFAVAAEDKNSSGGIGPDPKHVSGAGQKGAGPTGIGGTGLSATGANAAQNTGQGKTSGQASGVQNDGSGMAYIDCPGNAFSGGIRNDPKGRDCVQPESVVIQGGDNMSRGSENRDESRSTTPSTVAGDTDTGTNAKVSATSGNDGKTDGKSSR